MNSVFISKVYEEPPFCEKEILRYAGCGDADSRVTALLHSCIDEARDRLTYKVCFRELPVEITDSVCDFGVFRLYSDKLALNLKNCEKAVAVAATVGVGIDRLITKYGRLSPSRALMLQAIGAERIETLCDTLCRELADEYGVGLRPRFSPGYGDLPLEAQRELFAVLDCEKHIGLTLTDSLLMSPSKSVTAIVGIGNDKNKPINKCSGCNMKNCTFRGAL